MSMSGSLKQSSGSQSPTRSRLRSKSNFLPPNHESSSGNKPPGEDKPIIKPLLIKKPSDPQINSDNYLRSRKGKAGILYEIEHQEREEQQLLRQKLLSMKDEIMADRHVSEKFVCGCSVCFDSVGASLFNATINTDNFINNYRGEELLPQDQDRDFCFVMRKLIPPKHIQRSLRLYVPETVTFNGGEAKYIVMTARVHEFSTFIALIASN